MFYNLFMKIFILCKLLESGDDNFYSITWKRNYGFKTSLMIKFYDIIYDAIEKSKYLIIIQFPICQQLMNDYEYLFKFILIGDSSKQHPI